MARCSCQAGPAPQARGQEGPTGLFGIIGLDAADVRRLLRLQDLHQLQEAHLKLGGDLVSQGERKADWGLNYLPYFLPPPSFTKEEARPRPPACPSGWTRDLSLGTSLGSKNPAQVPTQPQSYISLWQPLFLFLEFQGHLPTPMYSTIIPVHSSAGPSGISGLWEKQMPQQRLAIHYGSINDGYMPERFGNTRRGN